MLTVGPAQGDLLLRTTAEGRGARLGHDLTFRVRTWQCVALVDQGVPVRVEASIDLATLEVLRGDGGLKPLTDGDKRRVLSNARKTIGPNSARFLATEASGGWTLRGQLDLHGVARSQVVQVSVTEEGPELRIEGRASVRQSSHGITPYSQMMGTLQVGDLVEVHVEVRVPRP
jgi:hypothetical protein